MTFKRTVLIIAISSLILSLLNTAAIVFSSDKIAKFMEAQTAFNENMIEWGKEMVVTEPKTEAKEK